MAVDAVLTSERTREPMTTRPAAEADVGMPKNGDVITPLKLWGLTMLRTLVARI